LKTSLSIKVTAKASRAAILGWHGGELKIAVTAAPERGKANAAVIDLLAERLGLAKSALRVISGASQPRKRIEIEGLDEARLHSLLPARPEG